jgi:hypothetical protein
MASTSKGTDLNWYLNSDTTHQITGELERLTTHDRYNGGDQIRAANGQGMDIDHIGDSVISTLICPLHLKNVLHVPHTHKQLIFIHYFTLDNNTFIEFHPFFFLVKDQVSKKVMLLSPCRRGLYPLYKLLPPHQKLLLVTIKPSSQRWHCCPGHPSKDIVHHVLQSNNLSCSSLESPESVCDAFLRAKAHQLCFAMSSNQFVAHLELIFSDV